MSTNNVPYPVENEKFLFSAGQKFVLAPSAHSRHYYAMKKIIICSLFLATVVFCGCEHFIFSPYFTVEESGLNWVSIRHYNYKATPMQRVSVRIDGNGIVTVREGSSILVTNPFASSSQDANWGDIRETRLTLTREEIVPLFQMLVDKGLFKERIKNDKLVGVTNEAIFVSSNIGGKACGSDDDVFAIDPDLAEHLKMVMLMFYHPQPKHRR